MKVKRNIWMKLWYRIVSILMLSIKDVIRKELVENNLVYPERIGIRDFLLKVQHYTFSAFKLKPINFFCLWISSGASEIVSGKINFQRNFILKFACTLYFERQASSEYFRVCKLFDFTLFQTVIEYFRKYRFQESKISQFVRISSFTAIAFCILSNNQAGTKQLILHSFLLSQQLQEFYVLKMQCRIFTS